MQDKSIPGVQAIRPDREVLTRQNLPYFVGVSSDTAGARGLSMHMVVIPPGAKSEPHSHQGYETAIDVLQGRVQTRFGPGLAQSVISEAGDFLFIAPGTPPRSDQPERNRAGTRDRLAQRPGRAGPGAAVSHVSTARAAGAGATATRSPPSSPTSRTSPFRFGRIDRLARCWRC